MVEVKYDRTAVVCVNVTFLMLLQGSDVARFFKTLFPM